MRIFEKIKSFLKDRFYNYTEIEFYQAEYYSSNIKVYKRMDDRRYPYSREYWEFLTTDFTKNESYGMPRGHVCSKVIIGNNIYIQYPFDDYFLVRRR